MEQLNNVYPEEVCELSGDAIRLFEIFPNDDDDAAPVRGRFYKHSLQDELVYDALSYTWGDPTEKSSIQVEGISLGFQVPSSLEITLKDIRVLHFGRPIWIDAMCINQANLTERNHQVQLMREIYSRAHTVRVWLDISLDLNDPALSKLSTLGPDSVVEDLDEQNTSWAQIETIKTNPYWRRMWIQREISLARNISVHCRRSELPIIPLIHQQRLTTITIMKRDVPSSIESGKATNNTISRALAFMPYGVGTPSERLVNPFFEIHQFRLVYDALHYCRFFEVTDPRDKIFALAGTIDTWKDLHSQIDYRKSVAEAYATVAKHMITQGGSLEFLCQCDIADCNPIHNLPSWVPDFSGRGSTGRWLETAGNRPVPSFTVCLPYFSSNDKVLHVSAVYLDTLLIPYRQVSYQNILHELPAQKVFELFKDVVWSSLMLREAAGIYPPTELQLDWQKVAQQQWRLVQVLTENAEGLNHTIKEYVTDFARIFGAMEEITKDGHHTDVSYSDMLRREAPSFCGDPAEYESRLFTQLRGRVLYLSKRGILGMAPKIALPKDEIWLLPGCRWPLVLRPKEDYYVVVGPAYHQAFFNRDLLPRFEDLDNDIDSIFTKGWENMFGKFEVKTIALH